MLNNVKQLLTNGTEPARVNNKNESKDQTARYMAENLCSGFQLHDRGQRTEAKEAFAVVDRLQFAHLDRETADATAEAYVDALWEKDAVEKRHLERGAINPESIAAADWSDVLEVLERRAEIAGMSSEYATQTTEAWRKHKTGEDYWTAFLKAQTVELRAAMQNPTYPEKPKEGLSGFGPVAARYVLGVELHDMHTHEHWEEAIRVMVPYYRAILNAQAENEV